MGAHSGVEEEQEDEEEDEEEDCHGGFGTRKKNEVGKVVLQMVSRGIHHRAKEEEEEEELEKEEKEEEEKARGR